MRNLKVRKKLQVGFLSICAFSVIIGILGMWGMNSIYKADENLYNHHLLSMDAISGIYENFSTQRVIMRDYVIYAGNAQKASEINSSLNELGRKMDILFAKYEAAITSSLSETAYFNAKDMYSNEFDSIRKDVSQKSEVGFEQALAVLTDPFSAGVVNSISNYLNESINNNRTSAQKAVEQNGELFSRLYIAEMVIIAISIVTSVTLSMYISALISNPLNSLTTFMKKAGETGDITLRPEDVANIKRQSLVKDEIGECIGSTAMFVNRLYEIEEVLKKVSNGDISSDFKPLTHQDNMGWSVQKMVLNLNEMFRDINKSTIQVAAGSRQVSDGAQMLAQGSTEQAAAIEQLSSSATHISAKTKKNTELAVSASSLAKTIRERAEKGSSEMNQMLSAVQEIKEAGKNISNVIKVIDDIAFQTNILALNAAVEAARAGQHGKGFAVVAEEVRNLAAKSAEAAKNTGSLIVNSIEKSELGAQIAEQTSESLIQIVSGINESGRIIDDIAKSSEEQSVVFDQINIGIEQVSQVVQQNSATAQESASASEEMREQARILESLVVKFKLMD